MGSRVSAAVITTFVVYVGIAMVVVLRAVDQCKAEIRYRISHNLLELFHRRGRR